jgi:hypothetical protein
MSNLRIAVNAFETAFVVIDSVAMISAWVIRTKLLELTRSIRRQICAFVVILIV